MNSINGWKYQCQYGKEVWEGSIKEIALHNDYVTFTVIGRGSSLQAHMGTYNGVTWICFPVWERACTLAHYDDLFWNSEKLGAVLESSIDGITVFRAIQEFDEYYGGFQGYLE